MSPLIRVNWVTNNLCLHHHQQDSSFSLHVYFSVCVCVCFYFILVTSLLTQIWDTISRKWFLIIIIKVWCHKLLLNPKWNNIKILNYFAVSFYLHHPKIYHKKLIKKISMNLTEVSHTKTVNLNYLNKSDFSIFKLGDDSPFNKLYFLLLHCSIFPSIHHKLNYNNGHYSFV